MISNFFPFHLSPHVLVRTKGTRDRRLILNLLMRDTNFLAVCVPKAS